MILKSDFHYALAGRHYEVEWFPQTVLLPPCPHCSSLVRCLFCRSRWQILLTAEDQRSHSNRVPDSGAWYIRGFIPPNNTSFTSVGSMLAQRLRRRANIEHLCRLPHSGFSQCSDSQRLSKSWPMLDVTPSMSWEMPLERAGSEAIKPEE